MKSQKNTLKNITSPWDEAIDLSSEESEKLKDLVKKHSNNKAIRMARSASKGLILLYPISKNSKPNFSESGDRVPLYEDSSDSLARNLIGLAISFPKSSEEQSSELYVEGTVPWRSADEL